jgi:hypothetical protein
MRTLLPHDTFLRQSAVGTPNAPQGNTRKKLWSKGTQAPPGVDTEAAQPSTPGRIGGMIFMVGNKWSKHIKDWWKDPSGSVVVSSVTFKAMSQDINIFGIYWPFMRAGSQTSDAAGSLWTQPLERYLQPNGIHENPRDYVESNLPTDGAPTGQGTQHMRTHRGPQWKSYRPRARSGAGHSRPHVWKRMDPLPV